MRFLFKPISPWRISQKFDENRACIPIEGGKIISCDGHNPPEGYRSLYKKDGHGALDIPAKRHTPIYSSQDCVVMEVVDEERRGLGLGLVTVNKFPCKETGKDEHFKIRYWHNALHKVRKGDRVKIGDLIAWADNTGYSSGDHLHYELKPVRIQTRKGEWISTTNILQDNGYYGSVDPEPYLRKENASSLQGIKTFKERLLWALRG